MPRIPLPPSGGPTASQFLALVAKQIGTPYVWGGSQPGGFDCSGLIYWGLHALGINAPRTSEEQWAWVQRIQEADLQPGDLIFEQWPGEVSPGHVVVYAGGNQIIQAPATGQKVQRDSWSPGIVHQDGGQIVGYGRIPGLSYTGEPFIPGSAVVGGKVPGGGGINVSGIVGDLTNTLSLPGAWASDILGAGSGIAQSLLILAAPFRTLAEILDWLLHPNHWIRIFAGLAGGILVLMGIWTLTHVGGA